jgi:hypothetical protein
MGLWLLRICICRYRTEEVVNPYSQIAPLITSGVCVHIPKFRCDIKTNPINVAFWSTQGSLVPAEGLKKRNSYIKFRSGSVNGWLDK